MLVLKSRHNILLFSNCYLTIPLLPPQENKLMAKKKEAVIDIFENIFRKGIIKFVSSEQVEASWLLCQRPNTRNWRSLYFLGKYSYWVARQYYNVMVLPIQNGPVPGNYLVILRSLGRSKAKEESVLVVRSVKMRQTPNIHHLFSLSLPSSFP